MGLGTSRSAKSSADPLPGISPKKATSKDGSLVVQLELIPLKSGQYMGWV
jgi:hypothetical protein